VFGVCHILKQRSVELLFFGAHWSLRCEGAIVKEYFVFIWRNACTMYMILSIFTRVDPLRSLSGKF
jgi:hypothetical protein